MVVHVLSLVFVLWLSCLLAVQWVARCVIELPTVCNLEDFAFLWSFAEPVCHIIQSYLLESLWIRSSCMTLLTNYDKAKKRFQESEQAVKGSLQAIYCSTTSCWARKIIQCCFPKLEEDMQAPRRLHLNSKVSHWPWDCHDMDNPVLHLHPWRHGIIACAVVWNHTKAACAVAYLFVHTVLALTLLPFCGSFSTQTLEFFYVSDPPLEFHRV